ncbi:hypothetical protein HYH03_010723 [Edaphochlamys debaryana]|uniref:Protein kinase domain-containing protein n=1 Tax=Edaphochlamys debaryana TaxID=47281 RepID=A0A835XVA8_9CHLO|nr:hypothetical protein HYH03_010723 [Edaphochlamys debaryana]|eukprot:KAG2490801.1 hypothetical protein HYH03_010723 [Edaphochlamys debaryana]
MTLSRVVLTQYRKGPVFQAPGIDFLATGPVPSPAAPAPAWGRMRAVDLVMINRACLAPRLLDALALQSVRPIGAPGQQRYTPNASQAGCLPPGSPGASLATTCAPQVSLYEEIVAYGTVLDAVDKPVLAGYWLEMENTEIRCTMILDADCVARLSSLGCFYSLFPRNGTAAAPAASPPPPSPPLVPPPPSAPGLQSAPDDDSSAPLGAILGGVLGGVAGLCLLGTLAWLLVLRRRRRAEARAPPGQHALLKSCSASNVSSGLPTAPPSRGSDATGHGLSEGAPCGSGVGRSNPHSEPHYKKLSDKSDAPVVERQSTFDTPASITSAALTSGPHQRDSALSTGDDVVTKRTPMRLDAVLSVRMGLGRAGSASGPLALHTGTGSTGPLEAGGVGGSGGAASGSVAGSGTGSGRVTGRGVVEGATEPGQAGPGAGADEAPGEAGEVTLLPQILGKGTFGRVQLGTWGGRRVAVKLFDVGLIVEAEAHLSAAAAAAAAGQQPAGAPGVPAPAALDGAAGAGAAAGPAGAAQFVLPMAPLLATLEPLCPEEAAAMVAAAAEAKIGALGGARGFAAGLGDAATAAGWLPPLDHAPHGSMLLGPASSGAGLSTPSTRAAEVASGATDATSVYVSVLHLFGDSQAAVVVDASASAGVAAAGAAGFLGGGMGTGAAANTGGGAKRPGPALARGVGPSAPLPSVRIDSSVAVKEGGAGAGLAEAAVSLPGLPAAQPTAAAAEEEAPAAGAGAAGPAPAAAGAGAPGPPAAFELALCRSFLSEVEVMARMRHPNIVRLLAASLQPPRMCLVLELMDTSLDRLLYGSGPGGGGPRELMPLPKVVHIVLQVAQALSYMHPTVIHCDLKPGNILLSKADSPTPAVKLGDFGLSRLQSTIRATRHADAGTAAYMSPETLSPYNHVVTHHVDMYALGVILWEMLAGQPPWQGLTLVQVAVAVGMKHMRPPLHRLPQERCPQRLRHLINCCWETDPYRRPAAEELAKGLMLALEELEHGRPYVPGA